MWIGIARDGPLTLARQIYDSIREKILEGAMAAGEKLPSTRSLAGELDVSRNTVLDAYNQLIAEGWLEASHGSGTRVAEGLRGAFAVPARLPPVAPEEGKGAERRKAGPAIDFRSGIPDAALFPRREWSRLYREVCLDLPDAAYGYGEVSGVRELRREIARYLFRARGITCDPERMLVTSGSTQGLSLLSRLLRDEGGKALVEDPSHPGLRQAIALAGCRVEGVPADGRGLDTDRLRPAADVSFVCVTPSHQYPLGGILPIRRRLALIRYAGQNGCYIAEDDYDSEFRYEGPPVSSLYELDPERVIYLGSFSKILAPALRLGFMILPEKLLAGCRKLKNFTDVHSDALTQYALARFMSGGGFERHVWKMKKHYARKRDWLLGELEKRFPGRFEVLGRASGLHLVVRFPGVEFSRRLVGEAARQGVRIHPVGDYYLEKKGHRNDGIIMGYSHLSRDEIAEGVEILSRVVRSG